MAKKKEQERPMWMRQPEFRRMFGVPQSTFFRWKKTGVIPASAFSVEAGRHPYIDAAAVFPERVAAIREFMEGSEK